MAMKKNVANVLAKADETKKAKAPGKVTPIKAAAKATETKPVESVKEEKLKVESSFKGAIDESRKIKMLVKENPKQAGSKSRIRFDNYKDGLTVLEQLKRGSNPIRREDIRWDLAHGHIELV